MLRVTESAFRSDTGRQRNANEDSFFARSPVFVVADGMGGAQAGEVASAAAAGAFEAEFPAGPTEKVLREIIEQANREIHELAKQDASRAGMGTTLTAAVLVAEEEELVIGHVGDSRAYRFRDGKLDRLTRDHSLVEEMRAKGQLTDEQAEEHPQRSIITRALGPEKKVQVDLQRVPVMPDDVFLLCSDGLTTMINEQQILQLLTNSSTLEAAVRALIDEANRAGGRDNITAVLFRVDDAAAPAAKPESPTLVGTGAADEGLMAEEVRAAVAAETAAGGSRRPGLRRALKATAAVLLLAAVFFGAWYGNRQVWFLGTDNGGRVALYRGLPYDLPFGISLYDEHYSSPTQTDSLPPRRRGSVTDHELRSRGDAVSLIEDLERLQGLP